MGVISGILQLHPPNQAANPSPGLGTTYRTNGGGALSFLAFLLLGLIAGAIAKAILPGRQGGGWIVTLLLGVVGALLGGWLGGLLFGVDLQEFWSIQTWLVAIVGSIIVLLIYGLLTRNSRKSA